MTRRPKRSRRVVAMLITSLAATAAIAAPAFAQGQTKTFDPVHQTRHRLLFAPKSVSADAVQGARVHLRVRRTGASWVRRVEVAKVRRAVERGSRVRIHKRPLARGGRLKIRIGDGQTIGGGSDEPPTSPAPSDTIPSDWRRSASFESSLNADSDYGWRADSPFDLTRTSEVGGSDGDYAAKIVTNGGSSGCSCPRMTFDNLSYGPGDEVWIGGAWRIPDPSKLAWSRLMNLGHFESSDTPNNWYLGLLVRDSGMEVVARNYNTDAGQSVLMGPRAIPQGRWFDVDLHFRLSPTDGQALTEVYLDGALIASTTKRNMYNAGALTFYNAGLSYFWPGNGSTTVYFDAPRLAP